MTQDEIEFCKLATGVSLGGVEVKLNTWELSEKCILNGVPGDFVEMGVYGGTHPAIMAKVCMKHKVSDRKVHLFDSFEGLPKVTENECEDAIKTYGLKGDAMSSCGIAACGLETVQGFMRNLFRVDESLLVYHKGWFQHTLPVDADSIKSIAVLRLDVDLYDSTKVCLEHLYRKVSKGGYIISDDFGAPTCRKAYAEFLATIGEEAVPTPVKGQETTVWWQRV